MFLSEGQGRLDPMSRGLIQALSTKKRSLRAYFIIGLPFSLNQGLQLNLRLPSFLMMKGLEVPLCNTFVRALPATCISP